MPTKTRLLYFNDAIRLKGRIVKRHSHSYHEIVFYVYGQGQLCIGQTQYAITNGTYCFVPRGVPHDEVHEDESHVVYIGFDTANDYLLPPAKLYTDGESAVVLNDLTAILRETSKQDEYLEMMMNALLNVLLIHIARHVNPPAVVEHSLAYAIAYIREYYNQAIILNDLARNSGYSYSRFQHRFKEETGMSPKQFIIEERLQNAYKLLPGKSCTEVAYICGFSTPAQFTMFFQRRFGVNPSSLCRQLPPEDGRT